MSKIHKHAGWRLPRARRHPERDDRPQSYRAAARSPRRLACERRRKASIERLARRMALLFGSWVVVLATVGVDWA